MRKIGPVQRGRRSESEEDFPLKSLLKNAARQVSVDISAHEGDGDAHHAENHASRHASGGADALKLDDLAAPDDNTDLNATTAKHGLLPKLSNVSTQYLDGTGAWSTPAGSGSGNSLLSVALHAGADGTFVTTNVNSTTYVQIGNWTVFRVDFSVIAFTHFRIHGRLQANAAGATVTMQLAEQATPTTPLSAAGDDLVVTNTAGFFDSGWVAFGAAQSTDKLLVVACKGSTATVDLSSVNLFVDFKKV